METDKTVYISGGITGIKDYKNKFLSVVEKLKSLGYTKIINPCNLDSWCLDYEQYMNIDFACIEVSDIVVFMEGYENSKGALREYSYAKYQLNKICIEEKDINDISIKTR